MNTIVIPYGHFEALRRLECDKLQAELDRAVVLDAENVPADVVTMHTPVRYVDEATGEHRIVMIVYPNEADAARGRISVLAPVGAALLGLSVGHTIEWEFPHGERRRLRVLDVLREARESS